MSEPEQPADRLPIPLAVAAGLSAIEGLVLMVYGIVLIPSISAERAVMGASTDAFFVVYGGFLAFVSFKVARRHSWARAPIMLAQLIQIMVGFTWGNTGVAVALTVPALVVIGGVFHPASIRALAQD